MNIFKMAKDVAEESQKKIEQTQKEVTSLNIKVLGSCCDKCGQLKEAAKEALNTLALDVEVETVSDFAQIASFGVMVTPALVVNGKVVSCGKVLKPDEIIAILKK